MSRDAHSGGATHYPNAAWLLAHAFASLMDPNGRVRIEGFYDDLPKPTTAEREMLDRMPEATRQVVGIELFAFGRGDDAAKRASVFEPTCNVCGIESDCNGPRSKTVIPCKATGKIDFRLVPDRDPERIAKLLRAHLDQCGFGDVEFSAEEGEHPYRGPADAPLVRAGCRRRGGGVREARRAGALKRRDLADVGRLHREADGQRDARHGSSRRGAHAPNEHIRLENYWRALRATARLYQLFATQS
jgi:acetylornithine deacetylase/succinyl-diaminopimelate desuccinylase-like protein